MPKWAKTASNACITPAVRLSCSAGMNQLITSGGRIRMHSTKIMATNIAFGNSLLGSLSSLTWTAFISMPGVGTEVADDQHDARDPGPGRQHVIRRHRCGRRVALRQVDDAQDHQQGAGNQGPDHDAAGGELRDHTDATTQRQKHPQPVDRDDHYGRPHPAGGPLGIDHVRQRAGHEGQQGRVVEDRHRVLVPGGDEAHVRRDALGDPAEHAALPARGELGRDQCRRDQEDDRRKDVEKDAGQPVDGHRRCRPQAGDRGDRHQRERSSRRCSWVLRLRGRRRPAVPPPAAESTVDILVSF